MNRKWKLSLLVALLVASKLHAQTSRPSDFLVRVDCICQVPNLERPWTSHPAEQTFGSGVAISKTEILTNAHLVGYSTRITVTPSGSSKSYFARVTGISHDLDIALLTLKDDAFKGDLTPVTIKDELPELMQNVRVYGHAIGGSGLSVSKGVVSRINFGSLAGLPNALTIQVDAAINPGNSGGAAMVGDELIGLVYAISGQGQNIGYALSTPEIKAFLDTVKKGGTYAGRPLLTDRWQPLQNDSIRSSLKLDDGIEGILITKTAKTVAFNPLRVGDILTRIEHRNVDNLGQVSIRKNLKLNFNAIVAAEAKHDEIQLTILRNGVEKECRVPLGKKEKPLTEALMGKKPSYLIHGPYVFTTVSSEHRSMYAAYSQMLLLSGSSLATRAFDSQEFANEELVLIVNSFPHESTIGYQPPVGRVVDSVNGIEIKSLAHLARVLSKIKDKYVRIEFADNLADSIVLRTQDLPQITRDVLRQNGISQRCSADLNLPELFTISEK